MEMKIRLNGITPLVMHSNRLANPLDPMKKELATLTGKKKKTDADYEQIAKIEFRAGLYINGVGPIIPSNNLRKMLIEGGRKSKMGKQFESGLCFVSDADLEYEGPREAEELWKDGRFTWTTAVGNQRNTVMRTRPRFNEWACEFTIEFDDDLLSESDVSDALSKAERGVGVCDGRALGLGRFKAEIVQPASH